MSEAHREHYESVAYSGVSSKLGSDEYARVMAIKSLIPEGVTRILDCGCGDGRIGNVLTDDYEVEGCDISSGSLAHCRFPTVQAPLTALPYKGHMQRGVGAHSPGRVSAGLSRGGEGCPQVAACFRSKSRRLGCGQAAVPSLWNYFPRRVACAQFR